MTLVQECWGMIIENSICCHLLPKKILYDYWFVIGVSLGSSVGFGEVKIFWNAGDLEIPQKSHKIWGGFGDLNPKNPQNLYHLCPQNTPEIFLGICGDKTPKKHKIKLTPIPQKLSKLLSPCPVPKIWSGGEENRGSGPCFTTLMGIQGAVK